MPQWTWVEGLKRYRDAESGRFVASKTVRGWVEESVKASSTITDGLGRFLAQGQLAVGDWQALMRQEIKEEYVRQYLLGRGGLAQMTQADWGSIGGMLNEQYRWLDRFAQEVADGKLSESG